MRRGRWCGEACDRCIVNLDTKAMLSAWWFMFFSSSDISQTYVQPITIALHDTMWPSMRKPSINVLTTDFELGHHYQIRPFIYSSGNLKSSSPRRFGDISQMYSLYRSISESEKESLSLCISDWCLAYYFLVEGLVQCMHCVDHLFYSYRSHQGVWFHTWWHKYRYNQSNMLHCSFQEKQDKNWYYGCLQAKRNQWLWTLCFSKCYCAMWRGTTTVEELRPRRYATPSSRMFKEL